MPIKLSSTLSPLLPTQHGFFTRNGGVSSQPYHNLNASYGVGDNPDDVTTNRSRITHSISNTNPLKLFIPHQTHSKRVCTISHPHAWSPNPLTHPRADALVTQNPAIALGVTTADCVPILLVDPNAHIIAAIHGGWRGLLDNIIFETIWAMKKIGAKTQNILAAIGPCIAPPSYQIGKDFLAKLSPEEQNFVHTTDQGYHLDLPALASHHLLSCHVSTASICLQAYQDTYQNTDIFFSSRHSFHQQISHVPPPHVPPPSKPHGCQAAVISLIPRTFNS